MLLGQMTCLYSSLDTLDTTTTHISPSLYFKSNPNFVVWNTAVYSSSSCTSLFATIDSSSSTRAAFFLLSVDVDVVTVVTGASVGAGTRAVLVTAACFTVFFSSF